MEVVRNDSLYSLWPMLFLSWWGFLVKQLWSWFFWGEKDNSISVISLPPFGATPITTEVLNNTYLETAMGTFSLCLQNALK